MCRQREMSEGFSVGILFFFSPCLVFSAVVLSPAVISNSWPSYHPDRVAQRAEGTWQPGSCPGARAMNELRGGRKEAWMGEAAFAMGFFFPQVRG